MPVAQYVDNVDTVLARRHVPGDGRFVLAPGYGDVIRTRLAQGGGVPVSADAPLRFTVAERSCRGVLSPLTKYTVYLATSVEGDTLSGCVAEEGADEQYEANDLFWVRWTAAAAREIQLMAGGVAGKADDVSVVHKDGDETVDGTKTFAETIRGSITGNAGTVTDGLYTADVGTKVLAPDGDGSGLAGLLADEANDPGSLFTLCKGGALALTGGGLLLLNNG